jgi:hypothetical protein
MEHKFSRSIVPSAPIIDNSSDISSGHVLAVEAKINNIIAVIKIWFILMVGDSSIKRTTNAV